MENESDFFPLPWDPQKLLHEEVKILAQRVDALIKWTEEFEDQIIFFGKSSPNGAGKMGEQQSGEGKSPIPKLAEPWTIVEGGGKPEGSAEGDSKLEDKQGEENDNHEAVDEEGVEPAEMTQRNGEIDLFGASAAFADFKFDFSQQQPPSPPQEQQVPSTNKFSFLQFD